MTNTFQATVIDINKFGRDKAIIRLKPSRPVEFLAGQYMELAVAGLDPRPYSVANAPGKDFLEFHIKDNGRGGIGTHVLQRLKKDDEVLLTGPFGHCVYNYGDDSAKPKSLLFVAGGTGITQAKSIIEDLIARRVQINIKLYWGVDYIDDMYLDDKLSELQAANPNLTYFSVLAYPVGEETLRHEKNFESTAIFVSGPPAMVEATLPLLLRAGATIDAIYTDYTDLLDKAKDIARQTDKDTDEEAAGKKTKR